MPRTYENFLEDFSPHGQTLIAQLVEHWPHGTRMLSKEMRFNGENGRSLFRARCYTVGDPKREGLVIGDREESIGDQAKASLKEQFAGKPQGRSVEVLFHHLDVNRMADLVGLLVDE